MDFVVGRQEEKAILDSKLNSGIPELIAVYGRRRVGKTHLIRSYLKDHIVFEMAGIHAANLREQLNNFNISLAKSIGSKILPAPPANWQEALNNLDNYLLNNLEGRKPIVVFFDEFPWIHTPKSNFLRAFDHWWNSSGTKRNNLKVIICGSAASWMIDKVINDRGGLHNRVTQKLKLLPFHLSDTYDFLQLRKIKLDYYQCLQLYMAMGGIPFYLQQIEPGESAAQVIDRLCFTKDGILKSEFSNLYRSLFNNAEQYEKIVRSLSQKPSGLTRDEIISTCKLSSGGGTTRILQELEEAGFIAQYIPFGKSSKEGVYKLIDEYSIFYQKFIDGTRSTGKGTWLRKFNSPAYRSWTGIAFESVCLKHILQIKRVLGIEGVLTEESVWRHIPKKGGDQRGTQIDLVLDRQDHCINICEVKFSNGEFIIDKKYATVLDNKVNTFRRETATRKSLFLTFITTYGAKKNEYYTGRVVSEIVMNDLFK